jgi:hypothetical protein
LSISPGTRLGVHEVAAEIGDCGAYFFAPERIPDWNLARAWLVRELG